MAKGQFTNRQKNISRLLRERREVLRDKLKSQNYFKKSKAGFISLLELILVLAAILFLVYKMLNGSFLRPNLDTQTQQAAQEQGISTSNYKTLLDDTRSKVNQINRRFKKYNEGSAGAP